MSRTAIPQLRGFAIDATNAMICARQRCDAQAELGKRNVGTGARRRSRRMDVPELDLVGELVRQIFRRSQIGIRLWRAPANVAGRGLKRWRIPARPMEIVCRAVFLTAVAALRRHGSRTLRLSWRTRRSVNIQPNQCVVLSREHPQGREGGAASRFGACAADLAVMGIAAFVRLAADRVRADWSRCILRMPPHRATRMPRQTRKRSQTLH